jgi:hypothetical protein
MATNPELPPLMFAFLPPIPNIPPNPRLPQLKIKGTDRVRLEPDVTEWPQEFELRKSMTHQNNLSIPLTEWEVTLGRMRYDQLCYGLKY